MSLNAARINTIKVLISGSTIHHHADCTKILFEFNQITRARAIHHPQSRDLLLILHFSRGFEGALRCYISRRGINHSAKGIGQYLRLLRDAPLAKISGAQHDRFQRSVARVRNRFLHNAGAVPANEVEVRSLLGEIEACLAVVL